MRRCVIIGGADIAYYETVREYLRPDDFIICCDSGLKHYAALGVLPDLIIGDFDSHENPDLPRETIVLPCEKDDTDSMAAVREAAARGFENFLLVGVFGGRLDQHWRMSISCFGWQTAESKLWRWMIFPKWS